MTINLNKFNLKLGDTVICIKDHIVGNKTLLLKKGDTYEVLELKTSSLYRDEEYPIVVTTSNKGEINWSLDKNGPYYIFSEFLILDIKEQRKRKLEKLNSK